MASRAKARDSLTRYRSMRDFGATPEPSGARARSAPARRLGFVIQRHEASRLHYDFRLEWRGVLKSWAVPKGPPTVVGDKRLAVEVEDHPLEYAKFTGDIPEGHYGAGHVDRWDRGTWTPIGDVDEGLRRGRLEFSLEGERLHGRWYLVRTGKPARQPQWLLIKASDPPDPPARVPSKLKAPLPTRGREVPTATGWVIELAPEGERLLVRIADGEARCFDAAGKDRTRSHRGIARAAGALGLDGTWLDGFATASRYVVLDLPYLQGRDCRKLPLVDRRRLLEAALQDAPAEGPLELSAAVEASEPELLERGCSAGQAGLFARRSDAPYAGGRTRRWLEFPCRKAPARRRAPRKATGARAASGTRVRGRANAAATLRAVPLSHPERVLYPADRITKQELADYFAHVAPLMLPHLAARPIAVLRMTGAPHPFFHKHFLDKPAKGLKVVELPHYKNEKRHDYVLCESAEGLVMLAQLGVVELHTWGSQYPRVDRADRLSFDLDPDPELPWTRVRDAALELREFLASIGLESVVKTTGGKGLHVVVPLTSPLPDWDLAKRFARAVSERFEALDPGRFSATAGARNRVGRIFIDYLRNSHGATTVAAFSPRWRPGTGLSVPLDWTTLGKSRARPQWGLRDWPRLLAQWRADPWREAAKFEQVLRPAALAAVDPAGQSPRPARRAASRRSVTRPSRSAASSPA